MEPSDSNGGREASSSLTLTPRSLVLFREGISLVILRWADLHSAIEKQRDGQDYRQIASNLVSSILTFFARFRGRPLGSFDIIPLQMTLDYVMPLCFNIPIKDSGADEVTKELMVMYKDCLKGNYESIDKLRESVPAKNSVSHSTRVTKELMVMYKDCLKGNYESIDKLRESVPAKNSVSHSTRVGNEDEDEEASETTMDEPVNA